MNWPTVLIIVLLAAAVVLAVRSLWKNRGSCSCGGDCSRCGGCCRKE